MYMILLVILLAIIATCIYILWLEMNKRESKAERQRLIAEYKNAGHSTSSKYGIYSTEQLLERVEFQQSLTTPTAVALYGQDYALASVLVLEEIEDEIELRKAAGIA